MPIWRPTSYEDAKDDINDKARTMQWVHMPWTDIRHTLIQHQEKSHEAKTARQRRDERVPTQARHFYKLAANATTPDDIKRYKDMARRVIKQHGKKQHRQRHGQSTRRRSNSRENEGPQDYKSAENDDEPPTTATTPS